MMNIDLPVEQKYQKYTFLLFQTLLENQTVKVIDARNNDNFLPSIAKTRVINERLSAGKIF